VSLIVEPAKKAPEKGLKSGALGLISSTVIGIASTAPAYSLAATLGFVVVAIGLQSPIVTILAFIPMFFVSLAFQQMNKADPDCGASFTWATRAFNPRVGWMGGWGVLAADLIVMASLAQIAGQYVFDLFNANGIGNDASSVWVLLVGIAWIVAMTWICYVGIEISANFQKALLGVEVTMLIVLSVWALIRVGNGTAPVGHLAVSASWFNPFKIKHWSAFVIGLSDMLFIYWGWDTALNFNEETDRTPKPFPVKPASTPPSSCSGSTHSSSSRPSHLPASASTASVSAIRTTRTTYSPSSDRRSSVTPRSPRSSITSCS
jgi:amino acid transporter